MCRIGLSQMYNTDDIPVTMYGINDNGFAE